MLTVIMVEVPIKKKIMIEVRPARSMDKQLRFLPKVKEY